jgi:dihydroorotate dehydrogenase (NAD+) catalytic subunit
MKVVTSFKIGDVTFKNRVFVASGTFGYGDEVADVVDINRLGGLITKSLTLNPRIGNPFPRIFETASGLINSIGLANVGVENFIEEKLPLIKDYQTAIIVNVTGSTRNEFIQIIGRLENITRIDGYEINVSCPNVKEGGLTFGTDLKAVSEITKAVRKITKKPIILKLTPNVTRVSDFSRAAENEGADAVSLINTLIGMAIDIRTRQPRISTITGGLSGPAIKPIALAKVYEAANSVKIPVIGIGGISSAEDALEFLIVGAQAVEIGTANFIDPAAAIKIADDIEKYCIQNNIDDTQKLVRSIDLSHSTSVLRT